MVRICTDVLTKYPSRRPIQKPKSIQALDRGVGWMALDGSQNIRLLPAQSGIDPATVAQLTRIAFFTRPASFISQEFPNFWITDHLRARQNLGHSNNFFSIRRPFFILLLFFVFHRSATWRRKACGIMPPMPNWTPNSLNTRLQLWTLFRKLNFPLPRLV
jgi:hypothetical protein